MTDRLTHAPPKPPPAVYVETDADLRDLVATLADEPLIGVDTESNSLYAYRERVCLIQVSSRQQDYIIDPFPIEDLSPFGALLANPDIETIFHAAEYDLICLRRDYGFMVANLFDTMIAARICGHKYIGLNNLVDTYLGVRLDKSHQRDDWGKRPLNRDSLLYAQLDTHYLPALYDHLKAELDAEDHMEEARESFSELIATLPEVDHRAYDADGFWKLGLPRRLNPQQMGVLKEVYLLREQIAEERDRPPFKVLGNHVLIDLAQRMPNGLRSLSHVKGVGPSFVRQYGDRILTAIRRGREVDVGDPPSNRPPPQDVSDRYVTLHEWRKQRAQARGVESDVILSKQALWSMAYQVPDNMDALSQIEGIGPWRLKTYGDELLKVIEQHEQTYNGNKNGQTKIKSRSNRRKQNGST